MDTRTLAGTLVILLTTVASLGAVVAVFRRDRAMTTWALGFGGSALGFALLLLQGVVPPLVPILVGNGFVLSFHVALVVGLGFFLGRSRPWAKRFGVYLGLWIGVMVVFTVVWPSYPLRAAASSAFIVLFSLEFLVLLAGHGKGITRMIRTLLTGLAVIFVAFHGYRLIVVLFSSAATLFADGFLTSATFLVSLVGAVLWSGTLLLLDSARLQERVKADADEMARLNRLKDRVLAMTSHDLRGPLGNLQVLWGELGRRFQSGICTELDQELLALVDQSLAGTQSLLENLFAFAEAQRRRPEPGVESELAFAVSAVLDQWGPPARTKGVNLAAEDPLASATVPAAIEAVTTVLRNLVGNAVKFTPSGGSIRIRQGRDPQGQGFLEVSDTGIGMAPDLLQRSFQMEQRVSRPGTDGERGSGFGLVLVKELVDGWGGSLSVTSEPGKGTTVRVTFPVRPAPPLPPSSTSS